MDIDECYKTLELPVGSTSKEIKSAYQDLVQVWHPDRFSHSPQLREKAEGKLKTINIAYQRVCEFMQNDETKSLLIGLSEDFVTNISSISQTIHSVIDQYRNVDGVHLVDAYIDDYRDISFMIFLKTRAARALIQLSLDGKSTGYKYNKRQINTAISRSWRYEPEIVDYMFFRECSSIDNYSVNTYIVRESVLAFSMIWNIHNLPVFRVFTFKL